MVRKLPDGDTARKGVQIGKAAWYRDCFSSLGAGRSADALLCLARRLARLPAVLAALSAGRIDRARAAVFADAVRAR